MNAPSIDIASILEEDSTLGLTLATNLFVGKEPASPQDCVTVFDTPGFPPQLSYNREEIYEYPSVQIRVRNKSYQSGWDMIEDIKNALHGQANVSCDTVLYTVIYCSSGPALLDWDENGRCRFIVNFNLQRR